MDKGIIYYVKKREKEQIKINRLGQKREQRRERKNNIDSKIETLVVDKFSSSVEMCTVHFPPCARHTLNVSQCM